MRAQVHNATHLIRGRVEWKAARCRLSGREPLIVCEATTRRAVGLLLRQQIRPQILRTTPVERRAVRAGARSSVVHPSWTERLQSACACVGAAPRRPNPRPDLQDCSAARRHWAAALCRAAKTPLLGRQRRARAYCPPPAAGFRALLAGHSGRDRMIQSQAPLASEHAPWENKDASGVTTHNNCCLGLGGRLARTGVRNQPMRRRISAPTANENGLSS